MYAFHFDERAFFSSEFSLLFLLLLGVAPGVKLYAVKVCSAVSSSCSGRALLQGIEYAIDPNGDGDFSGTYLCC